MAINSIREKFEGGMHQKSQRYFWSQMLSKFIPPPNPADELSEILSRLKPRPRMMPKPAPFDTDLERLSQEDLMMAHSINLTRNRLEFENDSAKFAYSQAACSILYGDLRNSAEDIIDKASAKTLKELRRRLVRLNTPGFEHENVWPLHFVVVDHRSMLYLQDDPIVQEYIRHDFDLPYDGFFGVFEDLALFDGLHETYGSHQELIAFGRNPGLPGRGFPIVHLIVDPPEAVLVDLKSRTREGKFEKGLTWKSTEDFGHVDVINNKLAIEMQKELAAGRADAFTAAVTAGKSQFVHKALVAR